MSRVLQKSWTVRNVKAPTSALTLISHTFARNMQPAMYIPEKGREFSYSAASPMIGSRWHGKKQFPKYCKGLDCHYLILHSSSLCQYKIVLSLKEFTVRKCLTNLCVISLGSCSELLSLSPIFYWIYLGMKQSSNDAVTFRDGKGRVIALNEHSRFAVRATLSKDVKIPWESWKLETCDLPCQIM